MNKAFDEIHWSGELKPRDDAKTGYWYPTAFSVWGLEEHVAWQRVRESGQYTMGSEVRQFEVEFALYQGVKHAIMVNSGSSANLVMIAALAHLEEHEPLTRGKNAFVPAIAWATTYAPLVQYGLQLKLLDVDHTWNADPYGDSMKGGDAHDCNLIVGCSVLGNPSHADSWSSVAAAMGAYYVEDNCESLGAMGFDGTRTGTHGLMNTFSFFYSHQISAIEGGMITTNDDECANLCRMMRNHGWSKGVDAPTEFDNEYDFRYFGYNVRPLELHAAIAREQLKKLDSHNIIRRKNADLFRKMVLSYKIPVELQTINGITSPFGLTFTIAEQNQIVANELRRQLAAEFRANGIDCRLPTGGSFRMHKYGLPWSEQKTPWADCVHRTGIFLGNGAVDLSEQIARAIDVMRKILMGVPYPA